MNQASNVGAASGAEASEAARPAEPAPRTPKKGDAPKRKASRRPRGTEHELMMKILIYLSSLDEGEPATTRDLCARFELKPNHLWKLAVALEDMGLVRKERGLLRPGAWFERQLPDTRFQRSLVRMEPAREAIAEYVANNVLESTDETLAMDSGATSRLVLEAIGRLQGQRTVYTNNVELGHTRFFHTGTRIELLGGRLDPDSRAIVAGLSANPAETLAEIRKTSRVDLSIVIPLSATWEDDGSLALWTRHPEEAPIRSQLVAAGLRTALLISPERTVPRGQRFASLGPGERCIRPIDRSVELVVAVAPTVPTALAFVEVARATEARVHDVPFEPVADADDPQDQAPLSD